MQFGCKLRNVRVPTKTKCNPIHIIKVTLNKLIIVLSYYNLFQSFSGTLFLFSGTVSLAQCLLLDVQLEVTYRYKLQLPLITKLFANGNSLTSMKLDVTNVIPICLLKLIFDLQQRGMQIEAIQTYTFTIRVCLFFS